MAKGKGGFDVKKIKDFLLEKGERLGLGLTAVIAVIVLALGFLGPGTRPPASAGTTWAEALDKAAKGMRQRVATSDPGNKIKEIKVVAPEVKGAVVPLAGAASPLFNPVIQEVDRRRNPQLLAANPPEDMQIDYKRAQALVYGIELESKKYTALGAERMPIINMEPRRMVVVTASYPYKALLEEYQKALLYETLDALRASPDMPKFLGMDVMRSEVLPGGKETKAIPIYTFDRKNVKTVVTDNLDSFFRRMKIDEQNPAQLQSYLAPNLVSPLPELASVADHPHNYPKIQIAGIEVAETGSDTSPKPSPMQPKLKIPGANPVPMTPGATGAAADKGEKLSGVSLAKLPNPVLLDRAKGVYNPLDPFGILPDKEGEKSGTGTPMPMGPMTPKRFQPMPSGSGQDKTAPDENKLLIRFIDVDVQVGKTYRYYFCVWAANPNAGKDKDTASQDMAKVKELFSPWQATPPIAIPGEHFVYVVDPPVASLELHPLRIRDGNDKEKTSPEAAPVQIHLWKDIIRAGANEYVIGDWVIAERLLIKRGEPIGRERVMVELPVWNSDLGRFKFANFSSVDTAKRGVDRVPVNFLVDNPPALMVDFQGGTHDRYKTPTSKTRFDEAAIDMLMLAPDGRLIVRNSRIDSDKESPSGGLREKTYKEWQERMHEVRASLSGATPGTTPGGLPFPGRKKN